jgi:hypothetical protein
VKIYNLYWLHGKVDRVEGDTIEQAFANAGFGGGAIRALDYYEEVSELPFEEKLICDEYGHEIINPYFIDQIKNHDYSQIGNKVIVDHVGRLFTLVVSKIDNYRVYFVQTDVQLKSSVF